MIVGLAMGTTLSQAISVAVSLAVIVRRRLLRIGAGDLRPQRRSGSWRRS